MTNALDGLRTKFRFILIQIEKAKEREITARRKTNVAIERTKVAEKKSYYLNYRCSAVNDRIFINGLQLERALLRLVAARNLCVLQRESRIQRYNCNDKQFNEEALEEKITALEVQELEYNSDTAVLVAKKEKQLSMVLS